MVTLDCRQRSIILADIIPLTSIRSRRDKPSATFGDSQNACAGGMARGTDD